MENIILGILCGVIALVGIFGEIMNLRD